MMKYLPIRKGNFNTALIIQSFNQNITYHQLFMSTTLRSYYMISILDYYHQHYLTISYVIMDDEGEAHQSIHVFTINMFFFCTGYSPTGDTKRAYLCLKHVRVGIKGDFFYQNSHCGII